MIFIAFHQFDRYYQRNLEKKDEDGEERGRGRGKNENIA